MSLNLPIPRKAALRKFRLFLLLPLLVLGGCLGHQKGSVVPGTQIANTVSESSTDAPVFPVRGNYYVEKLPQDGRGVNQMIVDCLRERGLKAATGEAGQVPEHTDIIVSYQDRWMWDMTMYMIRLNIQMKTPSGDLLASGESYRTSAIRKPPEYMINEILNEIYDAADPSLVVEMPQEENKPIRRSRQGNSSYNDEYRF